MLWQTVCWTDQEQSETEVPISLLLHQKTEVSRHFNREGNKGLDDVSIHVLEFIHHGPQSEGAVDTHISKEFDRIHRLRSQIPLGMNAIDSAY